MTKTTLKYAIALLFLIAVGFFFYSANPYFFQSHFAVFTMIFHLVLVAAFLVGFVQIKREKAKTYPISLFGLAFAATVTMILYQFFTGSFSILQGGAVVVEEAGSLIFVESELVSPEMTIAIPESGLVRSTKFVESQVPGIRGHLEPFDLIQTTVQMGGRSLLSLVLVLAFLLFFSSLGLSIFYRKEKEPSPQMRLISFFLGATIVGEAVFFLVLTGLYNITSLILLGVILLGISAKHLASNVMFLATTEMPLAQRSNAFYALLGFLAVFIGMGILDTVRPVPVAISDMNLYMRAAKNLAEFGYPTGVGPSLWTSLQSIPWLIVENAQGHMALILSVALAGLGSFFFLAKRFLKPLNALGATVFLALTPMVFTFLSLDLKVELPLLFTGVAALLAWTEWQNKKNNMNLVVAVLLTASVLVIKISALPFVLLIGLGLVLVHSRMKWLALSLFLISMGVLGLAGFMSSLVQLGISPGFFSFFLLVVGSFIFVISVLEERFWTKSKELAPAVYVLAASILFFLPWGILHWIQADTLSLSNLVMGQAAGLSLEPSLLQACASEQISDWIHFKRFVGPGSGLAGLLILPWTSLVQATGQDLNSDVSFLFIGIIPFFLLFPKALAKKKPHVTVLAVFAAAYFLFWWLFGAGVAWLLIPVLPVFAILLFTLLEDKEIWWRAPLIVLISISILLSFLLRGQLFAEQRMFAYGAGYFDKTTLIDNYYPGLQPVAAAIETYEGEPKLLRVGSQIQFFLPFPDRQVLVDDTIDQFACLAGRHDGGQLAQIYKDTGITHILLHKNAFLGHAVHLEEAFRIRQELFRGFLDTTSWPVLYEDQNLVLLELTSNE